MTAISRPLRLAEAVGALSLATDLAMGQPLEHGLRTAVLAVRIAQAMGVAEDEQVTVFYTGLLHFAGCTAESEIDARFFGDELVARPQMATVQFGSRPELMAMAARTAHRGSPPFTMTNWFVGVVAVITGESTLPAPSLMFKNPVPFLSRDKKSALYPSW